jgi:hypothetical protein
MIEEVIKQDCEVIKNFWGEHVLGGKVIVDERPDINFALSIAVFFPSGKYFVFPPLLTTDEVEGCPYKKFDLISVLKDLFVLKELEKFGRS